MILEIPHAKKLMLNQATMESEGDARLFSGANVFSGGANLF
jgi:hypothetical protein